MLKVRDDRVADLLCQWELMSPTSLSSYAQAAGLPVDVAPARVKRSPPHAIPVWPEGGESRSRVARPQYGDQRATELVSPGLGILPEG